MTVPAQDLSENELKTPKVLSENDLRCLMHKLKPVHEYDIRQLPV